MFYPYMAIVLDDHHCDKPLNMKILVYDWDAPAAMATDGVMQHRPERGVQISLKHAERLMAEVKNKNYPIAAFRLNRAKQA